MEWSILLHEGLIDNIWIEIPSSMNISVSSGGKFLWYMDTVFPFVNKSFKIEQLSLYAKNMMGLKYQ